MNRSTLVSATARAAALGITAGMRSQLPLALLARTAARTGPQWLRKRTVPTNLYLSAAGEIVGDKLPMTPSRLEPLSMAGRLVFGSFSGAILVRRLEAPVLAGVMAGALGAVAGSLAGYHARRWLGETSGLPDAIWAGAEDALAISIGLLATRE